MIIKDLIDEDFSNYKNSSMFIAFPKCSFKCEKEFGQPICQNSPLNRLENIEISYDEIVDRYLKNSLNTSIVLGGLEPFDSFADILSLIKLFRQNTDDFIIIYTGYYKNEILNQIHILCNFSNIIIKYGRYIPGHNKHYDDVLGVYLASDNQYAERIS